MGLKKDAEQEIEQFKDSYSKARTKADKEDVLKDYLSDTDILEQDYVDDVNDDLKKANRVKDYQKIYGDILEEAFDKGYEPSSGQSSTQTSSQGSNGITRREFIGGLGGAALLAVGLAYKDEIGNFFTGGFEDSESPEENLEPGQEDVQPDRPETGVNIQSDRRGNYIDLGSLEGNAEKEFVNEYNEEYGYGLSEMWREHGKRHGLMLREDGLVRVEGTDYWLKPKNPIRDRIWDDVKDGSIEGFD